MIIDEGLINYNSDDVNKSLKNHYKKKYRLSITVCDKIFICNNINDEDIIIKEFDKYRDKLVAIKCGHIFSAGKNAIQIIAAIGNSTSAAIIIENITHRSQLSLYLKFIFLLKFASIFIE